MEKLLLYVAVPFLGTFGLALAVALARRPDLREPLWLAGGMLAMTTLGLALTLWGLWRAHAQGDL